MKFGVIIAARMNSQRLPGKALLPFLGIPAIVFLLRRLKKSKLIHEIILATTVLPEDDVLAQKAKQEDIAVFRGSSDDVLSRYVEAARNRNFDYAVRVTGDCPFVDGPTLDFILAKCPELSEFDLVTTKPAYPHGIDYEIYPVKLLGKINSLTDLSPVDREHILNYLYRNEKKYKIFRLEPPQELLLEDSSFLLDTQSDYERLTNLCKGFDDIYLRVPDLVKRIKHDNLLL